MELSCPIIGTKKKEKIEGNGLPGIGAVYVGR
jgi:hypothetical protein